MSHAGRPAPPRAVHPADRPHRARGPSCAVARDALAGHPEDAGWSLGTDLAYLRELVAYWADGFDWPAQEAALAQLSRFRVPLGGLGIHFAHVRAAAPAGPVLPLVLSHGWPAAYIVRREGDNAVEERPETRLLSKSAGRTPQSSKSVTWQR